MNNMLIKAVVILAAAALPWLASAEAQSTAASIEEKLAASMPGLPITSITASRIDGLFQVKLASGERLFITADGSHFVVGDMFRIDGAKLVNLSELERMEQRQQVVEIAASQGINYTPANRKASVTVFTDVDCGYCRKLHSQMAGYLEKGIEIRYLAYPRAGVGSSVYQQMVSAWCATDQQQALNKLKAGQKIDAKECDNPVASHYQLGNTVGVTGTPALVLESGQLIPGYQTPEQLAKILGI